jgi:hypothetical protein
MKTWLAHNWASRFSSIVDSHLELADWESCGLSYRKVFPIHLNGTVSYDENLISSTLLMVGSNFSWTIREELRSASDWNDRRRAADDSKNIYNS